VRKQVPVVVANIMNLLEHRAVKEGYDGYGSCPLTTSKGTVMLAEFSYGGKVTPSFPLFDPRSNSRLWWLGKLIGFPWLYWQVMIKGYEFDIPHKASYAQKLVDKDTK
jgi:sulfide:quinone oxidoreductase